MFITHNPRQYFTGSFRKSPVKIKFPDADGRMHTSGKRKTAIARISIQPGTGKFRVNKKVLSEYFQQDACTQVTFVFMDDVQ